MHQRLFARLKQNLLRTNKVRRRAQRRQQLPIELRDTRAALQGRHTRVAHFTIFREHGAHALRILRVNAARIVREQFFNPLASFDARNAPLERGTFRKMVFRRSQCALLDFFHRKPSFRRFLSTPSSSAQHNSCHALRPFVFLEGKGRFRNNWCRIRAIRRSVFAPCAASGYTCAETSDSRCGKRACKRRGEAQGLPVY